MKRVNIDQNMKLLLATAVFASATFLLFGPIGQYIANLTEIWFPITDILWPSVAAFVLAGGVLTAIGAILRKHRKAFYGYVSLLWGLGLALYIQGNFIPNHYGILNGETVEWGSYWQKMLWDALIWAVCIALPFVLRLRLHKKSGPILLYGVCALLGVQLLATAMTCLTTDFSQSAVTESFLSDKGIYEVSDDQNVVVFVLDTYDDTFFDTIYEEDPEFLSFLDGFTYYDNMSCSFPNTRPAIPFILTQQYYDNQVPYQEYIADAWQKCADYYQTLKGEEFEIGIYTTLEAGVSNEARKQWVDNALEEPVIVSTHAGLETAMLRLTAMRYLPDFAKRFVWASGDIFYPYMKADSEYDVYDSHDTAFYSGLVEEGLSLCEEKRYNFIHLEGTHTPFDLLEDLSVDTKNATAISKARACMNIVREYIRQLKELGAYDNTCLIVTADHGYGGEHAKPNPIFLVKGFGEHGGLQFNYEPVSHINFMATVMEQLGVEDADRFGISVEKANAENMPARRYMLYSMHDSWNRAYLPDMYEYMVLPDSNAGESYIMTGNIYHAESIEKTVPYEYTLGDVIDFADSQDLSYFLSGAAGYADAPTENEDVTGRWLWSDGDHGRACFYVGEVDDDLICHIRLYGWVPTGSQRVKISAQKITLYDGVITSDMPYLNFAVPKAAIKDGLLTLDIQYPDAVSPFDLGISGDMRMLAIRYKQIVFEEQEPTDTVTFYTDGNAGEYFYSGWHAIEADQCWTNETASLLAILPAGEDQQMTVTYWTHPGAKDTAVYYNDAYIGTLPHHDTFAPERLVLPEKYRTDDDAQIITFVTDGAMTSKEYFGGDVTDERILGVALSEAVFSPANVVGRTILFNNGEALSYFTSGTGYCLEDDGLWTIGQHCHARFPVGEPDTDLICQIELYDWMVGENQRVQITSHGKELYSGTASNDMPNISFTVPAECAADGDLDLDFALPDARSPKSLGISEDERLLGVRFKSILFDAGP